MLNNDLVIKLRINSIDNGACLRLTIGNTATNVFASYSLLEGHATHSTSDDWQEISLTFAASPSTLNNNLDLCRVDDIQFITAYGNVDWNLQYVGLRPKTINNGIVTFTFDDGYKSQYTGIKALAEKGITATIFHIKEATDTGNSAYLTIADLQNLVNHYGADIEVHGDPAYDQWDETDLVAHWENSQKWLKENGLGEGKHMAYPNGVFPDNVVQLAKGYFDSCRTITSTIPFETYPPADRYRLRAVSSAGCSAENVATIKQSIDKTVKSGGWLILVFHKIEDGHDGEGMYCTEARLKDIADYAIASGAYIMNYAEVFDSGVRMP
jgi:peptidoglycan/xylan/chitin deacetylase (PgdA/CDA1 family)